MPTESPVALPPGPGRTAALKRVLLQTFAGRALLFGSALKILVLLFGQLASTNVWVQALDRIGGLAILIGGGYFLYRLAALAQRRLLWRVRRKLILSYIFIGVVPAFLIVAFFLLGGLLLFFNVASYLVQSRLHSLTEQTDFQARTAVVEIERLPRPGDAAAVLDRKQINLATRFPGASLALVPVSGRVCDAGEARPQRGWTAIAVGPWPHVAAPEEVPQWIGCDGFSGLIAWTAPTDLATRAREPKRDDAGVVTEPTHLAVRSVVLSSAREPAFAVIVDVPVNDTIAQQLQAQTGIQLEDTSVSLSVGERSNGGEKNALPLVGQPLTATNAGIAGISRAPSSQNGGSALVWVTGINFTEWATGEVGNVFARIALSVSDMYDRLSAAQRVPSGANFGQIILLVLAVVALLFLVIEAVALIMGLALARSITGSVHELFTGTERVRLGDFSHKITIDAKDQLGELADSFNSMTGSIEDLLRQAAEKKRLEEELRIAREIQMSLLPQGPLIAPGLAITAVCVPAREVGGDYYDFFPLGEDRLGVLIADVSGKGTSAALYMAELKGLMLSLSKLYRSPRELMIQANRIIADNLDARSFITMTYAVIDPRAQTMTYARAGHTPLIHLPPAGSPREAQILVPDGLVLGLKIDDGQMFERLLEEETISLQTGDLFVLFTDGVSEAMNEASDCFGESRLGKLIEEHGDMPFDQLRERILREIEAFVGSAAQHDDMTMILIKVQEMGAHASVPELQLPAHV
jgi:sigma-B regulation protein RsbU (phosphoserine phosphatase)